ncbi:MAG: helix-turn-helix domain-containing protein [Nocardioides sp.]
MTGAYRGREEFGARLRLLREAGGLNGKQFAARLGWPHSKVSKLELGRQRPTTDDVTAWAEATGAGQELDGLLADLRSLRMVAAPWTRQLRRGIGRRQLASLRLEAATGLIRGFQPAVIPGLLQTAGYARHLMTRRAGLHGFPHDIEEGVRVRLLRQQVLYDPDKRIRLLVSEAALRNRLCPAATLRAQLDRIAALSGLDTVEVAVISFDAELPMTTSHGFSIYDDRLVLVETLSSELSLRDPDDIDLYQRHFENLWEVALDPEASRRLVAETAGRL